MITNVTIASTCPFCGRTSMHVVDAAGFKAWQNGALIQNALPDLDADTREALISGVCASCWDATFPAEDED